MWGVPETRVVSPTAILKAHHSGSSPGNSTYVTSVDDMASKMESGGVTDVDD